MGIVTVGSRRIRIVLGLLCMLATCALGAQRASAAVLQADCTNLQTQLDAASAGDTVELTGMCTGGSYTIGNNGVTLEGAPGQTDGFDGTGASMPAIQSSAYGLTLRNLTVENYSLSGYAAVELTQGQGALPVLEADSFINNSESATYSEPAALLIDASGPTACSSSFSGTLTITGSTFRNNIATVSSGFATGGAAAILFFCSGSNTAALKLANNTFSANQIRSDGVDAYGAGLYIGNGNNGSLSAQQSGNVFTGNSITSTVTPASHSYNGAGEWLASVNLTSVGDEYIGNSLPGPSGLTASSWGAGLGTVRGSCGTPSATVTATASDLVAVGNTIGAPSGGGTIWGAGIYAGCTATVGSGGFHLTLINSTVTANTAPGGPAGVSGESTDFLDLQNTIVQGNTAPGSSDLGGFGIGGGSGSVTATYSDVCAVGSSTLPYAGTGNICADPKLANPAAGDVHETAASPTINAGSNALVPAGTTTDFYGQPRIFAPQSDGFVDIGAAEWQSAPAVPTASITAPVSGGTYLRGTQVPTSFSCTEGTSGPGLSSCTDSGGATGGTGHLNTSRPGSHTYTVTATSRDGESSTTSITYTVVAPAHITVQGGESTVSAGSAHVSLGCTAGLPRTVCRGKLSLTLRERIAEKVHHHRHRVRMVTITFGHASYRIATGHRGRVTVRLTRRGAHLLSTAKHHRLRVSLTVHLDGGTTVRHNITLRLTAR